jgi:hypothetical protein
VGFRVLQLSYSYGNVKTLVKRAYKPRAVLLADTYATQSVPGHPDHASGSVPHDWKPVEVAPSSTQYTTRPCCMSYGVCLRRQVEKKSSSRELRRVHYFEHASEEGSWGQVLFQYGHIMRQSYQLRSVLSEAVATLSAARTFRSGESGSGAVISQWGPKRHRAVQHFYNADNCLFVRTHFRSREANAIMNHGVQLPDLLDCLSPEEAQREFCHELETMRWLCLKLLEKGRSPRVGDRATA